MDTFVCRALVAFTHHISGFGMVHGDPESSDEAARLPRVPLDAIDYLVDGGKIEAPSDLLQLDHDGDGLPGGSVTAPGDLNELRAQYHDLAGKKAFNGWDADELTRRIAMFAGSELREHPGTGEPMDAIPAQLTSDGSYEGTASLAGDEGDGEIGQADEAPAS